MQTSVLKLWQDWDIFQDMEGLELNNIEIYVDNQDVKICEDMEFCQYLEAQHHKQYIVKPSGDSVNYVRFPIHPAQICVLT